MQVERLSQRELRNESGRVLRAVAEGHSGALHLEAAIRLSGRGTASAGSWRLSWAWLNSSMDDQTSRVVTASRVIAAPADRIFELIADPAKQPLWDGNDNLAESPEGHRVRAVGDVFTMVLTSGSVRENRIVEFEEGRRIAWLPSEVGKQPPGHLWRWELVPHVEHGTLVRHTYDWSGLTDETRLERAKATTEERLRASLDRLASIAEV